MPLTKTFCVLPWQELNIWTDGSVQLCCRAVGKITDEEGRTLRLDDTPFDEIWNSPYMVSVRKDMLAGRPRADCVACYEHEARMNTSMRMEVNEAWLSAVDRSQYEKAYELLETESEASGHVVARSPYLLHLWFGNQCNLKCRMCSAGASSRIAMDPVHSRWHPAEPVPPLRREKRYQDGRTWADSPSIVQNDLLREGNVVGHISFAGGEPFLQPQIEPLLQLLIDRGRAPEMGLYFSTNGTVFPPSLIEKLRPFKRVTLAVSVDGLGPLNDYVRHPARWDQVVSNLDRMQALDWLYLEVDPTVQAYNALGITSLLRYCDSRGLKCQLNNVLLNPPYLSLSALPEAARSLARRRLEEYAQGPGVSEETRLAVAAVVQHLQGPPPPEQPQLLDTFLKFTGELDASRGERLADVEPELMQLVSEATAPRPRSVWQRLAAGFRLP